MNRKQIAALKPGEIVKARKGKSGAFYEFEVISNEVLEWAGAWIKMRTLAWPAGAQYGWNRPPMLVGEVAPRLGNYGPTENEWETGKEVWVDTRYLRDVEADAARVRVASDRRERERQEEAAKRERFEGRRRAWANWFRGRGAEQGTIHRGADPTMVVNVTPHEAMELIKDLKVETRFTMVFVLDELGNVVGFGGGIGPE